MENDPGNLPASLNWVASAYFFSVVKLSERRPRTQKFLQLKTFGHFVVHFDYSLLKYLAPVDKAQPVVRTDIGMAATHPRLLQSSATVTKGVALQTVANNSPSGKTS